MVNGLTTLLDVVLEPASQDMAEPILMSLLYLLNDPKSRYVNDFYHIVYSFFNIYSCSLLFIILTVLFNLSFFMIVTCNILILIMIIFYL